MKVNQARCAANVCCWSGLKSCGIGKDNRANGKTNGNGVGKSLHSAFADMEKSLKIRNPYKYVYSNNSAFPTTSATTPDNTHASKTAHIEGKLWDRVKNNRAKWKTKWKEGGKNVKPCDSDIEKGENQRNNSIYIDRISHNITNAKKTAPFEGKPGPLCGRCPYWIQP